MAPKTQLIKKEGRKKGTAKNVASIKRKSISRKDYLRKNGGLQSFRKK